MKKIFIYNWVQFDDDERRGGGVSVYLNNIIPEYLRNGYQLTFLSSGDQYSVFSSKVFIEETFNKFQEQGLKSYRVVNSPVLAPAHNSFGKISDCLDNELISTVITNFTRNEGGYDEFHFHGIEGISTKVVDEIKRIYPNAKVCVWFHSYHWLCPQIELLNKNKQICTDYKNGHSCFGCLGHIQNSALLKRNRAYSRLTKSHKIGRSAVFRCLASIAKEGISFLSFIKKNIKQLFNNNFSLGDNLDWKRRSQLQTQTIKDIAKVSFFYRNWRETNIVRLNKLDKIYVVSDLVAQVIKSYGVDENLIEAAPLGMKSYKPISSIDKKESWQGRLHIAFFGYPIASKGLDFMLDSLGELDVQYLNKIELSIVSRLDDWNRRKLSYLASNLKLNVLEGYSHDEMTEIVSDIDLGIVPSIWNETYNQVSYELVSQGVPILISDTLGFGQFVSDEFKFKSNNASSLRKKLVDIIDQKLELKEFWEKQHELPSIQSHFENHLL